MSGLEGQVFSFGFGILKNVTDSNLYNFKEFLIRVFTMIKDHCKLPAGDCNPLKRTLESEKTVKV